MAQHIWLVRVAAVVGSLIGGVPALAQVPPEFHGAWSPDYGSQQKCTKADESDVKFTVHRQGITGWEHFCKLVKFEARQTQGQPEDLESGKTGTVELSCGEAGEAWRSREIWHVRSVAGQKILVITTFQATEHKDENDKKPFGPYKPRSYVSLNRECK